jgi:hypothetical protein
MRALLLLGTAAATHEQRRDDGDHALSSAERHDVRSSHGEAPIVGRRPDAMSVATPHGFQQRVPDAIPPKRRRESLREPTPGDVDSA